MFLSSARVVLLIFLALAVQGLCLTAQSSSGRRSAEKSARYRPWLSEVRFEKSPVIVVARLAKSRRLPNGETSDRMTVIETWKGKSRSRRLILGASSAFRARPALDKVLFLTPSATGHTDRLIDYVDLPEEGGAARRQWMREILEISSLRRELVRMTRVRDACLARVQTSNPWVKRVLVREVDRLTSRRPALFDGSALIRLGRFSGRGLGAGERELFRESLLRIEEANAVGWTADRLSFKSKAEREEFLRELGRFQGGAERSGRQLFLDRAAKRFGRRAAPLFLKSLDDAEVSVALAATRLLGELESTLAVSALEVIVGGKLRRQAHEEKRDAIRAASLLALTKIESPTSFEIGRQLVEDPSLGPAAIELLAALGPGKPRDRLLRLLRELEDRAEARPENLTLLRRVLAPEHRKKLDRERADRLDRYGP